MKKLSVCVLFGGVSPEHEVSLRSAESVLNHLNQEKYNVFPVGITKNGDWVLYGGKDVVVPPEKNIERFAPVFEANGGVLTIMKRGIFGHHPHGLDPSETGLIVNFFENAFNPPQKVEKKK